MMSWRMERYISLYVIRFLLIIRFYNVHYIIILYKLVSRSKGTVYDQFATYFHRDGVGPPERSGTKDVMNRRDAFYFAHFLTWVFLVFFMWSWVLIYIILDIGHQIEFFLYVSYSIFGFVVFLLSSSSNPRGFWGILRDSRVFWQGLEGWIWQILVDVGTHDLIDQLLSNNNSRSIAAISEVTQICWSVV